MNILQINDLSNFDTSIESYEVHSYNPYNNSFRENDEIRIPIHQQDIYVLPSASLIYIEGYAKIVIHFKHELILNRSNSNINSITGTEDVAHFQIDIQRIQWRVPHVKVSDRERLKLLKNLERDKPIQMAFRNWYLYEYPLLVTIRETSICNFLFTNKQKKSKNERLFSI